MEDILPLTASPAAGTAEKTAHENGARTAQRETGERRIYQVGVT